MEFMSRVAVGEGEVPTGQNQKCAAMRGASKWSDVRVNSVHNEGPAGIGFRTMYPSDRLLWRQAFQHGAVLLEVKEVCLAPSAVTDDCMQ